MSKQVSAWPIEVLWFDTVVTSGNQTYCKTDTQIPCLSSHPSDFYVKDSSPASKSFLTTAYESYTQKSSGNNYVPLKRFIAWIWVLFWEGAGGRGWVWKGLIPTQSPLFLPFMWAEEKVENNISSHPVPTHARCAASFPKPSHSNWWSSGWPRAAFQERLKWLGMCLGEKLFLWPLFKWSCYSFTNVSNYRHYNWNTGEIYLRKGG